MANETRKSHANINKVILSGRVAQDANYMPAQVDPQGTVTKQSVAYFALANNEGWVRRDGTDAVSFINCQITGKYADAVAQYLTKGTLLTLSGVIRAWTERDETTGQIKGNNYIIQVEDIDMASRPQNQTQQQTQQTAPAPQQSQTTPTSGMPTQAAQPYQAAPASGMPAQAAQPYQMPVAPQPPVQAAPVQQSPFQAAPQQVQYQAAPQQNQGFAYSNNPFAMDGLDASAKFAMN